MANAIFITFDDKFFKYAKKCLNSLERNYPNHPEILAFYDGRRPSVIKFLSSISNLKIMPFDFHFLDLDGITLGKVNSKKVYFRYILWTNQFDMYDTIVHLDIDTIILKPFDSLFYKKTFFAVSDFTPFGQTLFNHEHYENPFLFHLLQEDKLRCLPKDLEMINAGVFVIPKKYRNEKHFNKLIEITRKYNSFTDFADQAAISLWCHINNISFSSCIEFNFQTCFLANQYMYYNEMLSKKKSLESIYIMHFSWWKLETVFHKKFIENAKFLAKMEKDYFLD